MPPPRKTIPIHDHHLVVQITDDQSRTLINPSSAVAYHSASGAIEETRHVYLGNSGVADRLSLGLATSVLEIGLGTGMSMLLTLDAALAAGTPMDFTAIESQWLAADVLRKLNLGEHLDDPSIATRFLQWRESLGQQLRQGAYRWQVGPEQRVTVHHQDAIGWEVGATSLYDAIYFDPFAPDATPELWRTEFLSSMHGLLQDGGRLVTYCVNRKVRDDFASVGFNVQRVPGPTGGKREVLIATKRAGK